MHNPNQSEAELRVEVLTCARQLDGTGEARVFNDPRLAATARDLIREGKILGSDSSSGPCIHGIRPAGLQALRAARPMRRLTKWLVSSILVVAPIAIWILNQFITLDSVRRWLDGLVKSWFKAP